MKIRARLLNFFWPHYEYPTNLLTIKGGASRCLFRCQIGNLGIIDLNFESVKIHTIRFFGTFFVPFLSDTFRQYSSFSYFVKRIFQLMWIVTLNLSNFGQSQGFTFNNGSWNIFVISLFKLAQIVQLSGAIWRVFYWRWSCWQERISGSNGSSKVRSSGSAKRMTEFWVFR